MTHQELMANQLIFQFHAGMFFVFGSLLGSFCNVVVLRMAEEKSVVFPPSSCPHCQHRLSVLDLIPVFGWLLLAGKCRYCRAPISIQYPMVEFATALTLGFAFLSGGFTHRFIPQAAWGIMWLVSSVLAFRGEVRKPWPFLWPLLLRIPLGWWARSLVWFDFLLPVGLAGITAALVAWKNREIYSFAWLGNAAVGLLATLHFGWFFPAFLCAVAAFQIFSPGNPDSGFLRKRGFLLAWNLCGMASCAWFGTWGF